MNQTKLTNAVLERIERDQIKPRSKWYYRIGYGSFWALFGLMLLLGALSFAVMLFAIRHTDFAIFDYVDNGGWQQFLSLMPFVWVLLVGVAIGLGIWGLKHTKRGYRLAVLFVFGGNIFGSMLLGSIVYGVGGGEFIEEIIEETVPVYESVREKHEKFWGNPEKTGRLAGLVESVDTETGTALISGPRGREWEVPLPDNFLPEIGKPIKMRGQVRDTKKFEPRQLKRAPRQEHLQRKVRDRFEKRPELRAKFEEHLNPETREVLQDLKENGERPSRELYEQIREEIKTNTTPEERLDLRREVLPPREQIVPVIRQEIRQNPELREAIKSPETKTPEERRELFKEVQSSVIRQTKKIQDLSREQKQRLRQVIKREAQKRETRQAPSDVDRAR